MRIHADVVGVNMKFFKKSKRWMKTHWKNRSFRIFLVVNILLAVLLAVENMALFSVGVLKMLRYVILLGAVAVIACIDKRSKRIPNEILLALVYLRAVLLVIEGICYPSYALSMILSVLLGSILGGGMFLICYFITRGGVGMGDVKLFFVAGLYLGSGGIMAVVVTTVFSSAVYSIVQLVRRKAKLQDEIAFAPFVWIGLILAMALGI